MKKNKIVFGGIIFTIIFVVISAQAYESWAPEKAKQDNCKKEFERFRLELRRIYNEAVSDHAASPDVLNDIKKLLDGDNRAELLMKEDFREGLNGWKNESKYMGNRGSYDHGVSADNGYLSLEGMEGNNYYLVIKKEITTYNKYSNFYISYDWKVPKKENNYGAAYITIDYFDKQNVRIGRNISIVTSNNAHTLEYFRKPLGQGAFLGERIFNQPFSDWRKMSFTTESMPDLNAKNVYKIEVAIVIQNDAGNGAIMQVDNISVKGELNGE